MREYFRTVPLYLRSRDRIARSISETPGAMPLIVEFGIAENRLYLQENPPRRGYMKGKVPGEISEYWRDRRATSVPATANCCCESRGGCASGTARAARRSREED